MLLYPELSKQIIDAFYEVCNNLSIGYSEKVYERALVYELRKASIKKVDEQRPLSVVYKGVLNVGDFVADIVVDDKIVIELKAVAEITNVHVAQLINYLATTGMKVGYVLNFGGTRKFVRKLGPAALSKSFIASAFHDFSRITFASTLHGFSRIVIASTLHGFSRQQLMHRLSTVFTTTVNASTFHDIPRQQLMHRHFTTFHDNSYCTDISRLSTTTV